MGKKTKILIVATLSMQFGLVGYTANAEIADASDNTGASASDGVDCTEASVDFADDPGMTQAERVAAMDAAFQASLSKFDYCATTEQSASSSSSAGGGGSGGGGLDGEMSGTEGDDGLGDLAGTGSSASSDLSGSEPVESESEAVAEGDFASVDPSDAEGQPSTLGNEPVDAQLDNGAIPEDIPPAANDSAFEAQLRKAAMEEKDPELRERFWDEYRKYKGLPTKGSDS